MNILLLSRYGNLGASSRLRFYQYLPFLRQNSLNVTVAPLLDDEYLRNLYSGKNKNNFNIVANYFKRSKSLLNSGIYDLIWIEGEIFPWLFSWCESLLPTFGIPYVIDFDDALFHRYDQHKNSIVRLLLGSKIDKVMRSATLVIAGNEYIAKRAHGAGAKRVECLPTVIDLERYPYSHTLNNKVFTIGWIGTPSTSNYLKFIKNALSSVCAGGKARLLLIGPGYVEMDGVPVEIRNWSENREVDDLLSIDVGIMPLLDGPWERGKCGYKLIQYMACGIPVVASPIGVNAKIVDQGINGLLANTDSEWEKALLLLREDIDLRIKMGQAARRKVESEYNLGVTGPRLLKLLRSATKDYI